MRERWRDVERESVLSVTLVQAVQAGDDGMLSVAYGNAALAACVMLAREVRALRAELDEMKGA